MGGFGCFTTGEVMNQDQPGEVSAKDRQRLARMAAEAAAQLGRAVELARERGEYPPGMTLEQLDQAGMVIEDWGWWVANGCKGPMPGGSTPA
jgi:hypothetical protein